MNFKNTLKRVILKSGILRGRQKMLPPTALVLYFHSVPDNLESQNDYIAPAISVDAERFRDFMRIIRSRFNPVSLSDIADFSQKQHKLPPRSVAITFDDGFADNYTNAASIMEEFDIRGTFYLTSNCVEKNTLPWFCKVRYLFQKAAESSSISRDPIHNKPWNHETQAIARNDAFDQCAKLSGQEQNHFISLLEDRLKIRYDEKDVPKMMDWKMAQDLIRRNHIIGNHTFSHPNVAHVSPETQTFEIEESHRLLCSRLNHPVEHFSYPHPCLKPQHDDHSDDLVKKLGYKTIVLTDYGWVRANTSPFLIPRLSLAQMETNAFVWRLETAFAGIQT